MRIANNQPLSELRQAFSERFPFLEITFYRPGDARPVSEYFGLHVSDIRTYGNDGHLLLDGHLTPAAIEQTISEVFGIQVRVGYRTGFRLQGHERPCTLDGQNHWAMHLSEEVVIV